MFAKIAFIAFHATVGLSVFSYLNHRDNTRDYRRNMRQIDEHASSNKKIRESFRQYMTDEYWQRECDQDGALEADMIQVQNAWNETSLLWRCLALGPPNPNYVGH